MAPHYSIAVDDSQTAMPVDTQRLADCLQRVLAAEGVAAADLHLVLVEDAEIQRINCDYLEHDWPTDVISFSYAEVAVTSTAGDRWPRGQGLALDGEIVVSVETAVRQAPRHGWSPEDELLLYAVHGCLHLCGYDDLSDAERPLMRRRERDLLALFGRCPQGLEDEPTPDEPHLAS
jgi:probable rRNA maturation factor